MAGIEAQNKVYDGTNSATLIVSNAALVGVISGDTVTLDTTNAVGVFADKDVGTAKTVTVSGLALLGADAGKYTLTQPTTNADITPKALNFTGITAGSKVYDGTTAANWGTAASLGAEAAGSGTTADGKPYTGDTVTLGGTAAGTLAAKDVGAEAVTITGNTMSGAQAGDYTVTQQTGLTQTVTAKALAVSGITAGSTVYDGTTAAKLGGRRRCWGRKRREAGRRRTASRTRGTR